MSNEFVARKGLIALDNSQITGSLGVSSHAVIGGNITGSSLRIIGHISADTSSVAPAWKEGLLFWDEEHRTYSIYNEVSGVSLQIGQESYARVVAGENLGNGVAVYISSSAIVDGHSYPLVFKALADGTRTKVNVIGITTHVVASGSIGYTTTNGLVHELDTSALVAGSPVYLSDAVYGGLTSIVPSQPAERILVGYCAKSDPIDGMIYVSVTRLEEAQNSFVGVVSQPSITDNGGGNFTVSTGSANLCTTADGTGFVRNFPIASASFTIPADVYNMWYVVADYNSGNPIWNVVDTIDTINSIQITAAYSVTRALNGTIAYISWDRPGVLLANKILARLVRTNPSQRESGLTLSESGSSYITISTGSVWNGVNLSSIPSYDSSVNTLVLLSHSGSDAFSSSLRTTFVNDVYDNGTGLQNLNPNKYVVNYIYKSITNVNRALITLSTTYGDVAAAQTDQPWQLPGDLLQGGILVGRMIVGTGDSTTSLIESAFANTFVYSAISDHNALSNLQGGTVGEYYHLDLAQYNNLGVSSSYASSSLSSSYAGTSSFYRVANPTGQAYYGASTTSSVAGIVATDRAEDALNKIELILEKLAPAKPPNLSSLSLTMAGTYTAISASSNTSYNTVYFGSTPVFSSSAMFGDGDAGSLTASIDGVNVGSTVIAASPTDNVGTYGMLQITQNPDYWSGSAGKSGFWRSLAARINATGQVTMGPHSASLNHSTTGKCADFTYYIDDAPSPSGVSGTASGSGVTYISGVPALVGGVSSSAITFTATGSNTVSRFYNSTRIFAISGTGITTTNFTLPSSPVSGSIQMASRSVSVNAGSTSESPSFTVTAYNSRAVTSTGAISSTNIRLDSTVDTSNRVTSGVGQYPASGYGSTWYGSQPISGSGYEELQMLNGQHQYPTGNYTGSRPVAGPNYNLLASPSFGTIRWVTFSLGSQTAVQNVTITFANTTSFGTSAIIPSGTANGTFYLYVKVEGATGWVNGNGAYPGAGSPVNDGDLALDIANSTGTVKKVTFGSTTRTGVIYVRVGIASGQAYKFGSISATYS